MAGVVHFSWIARYMEEAEHALWRAAGLSIVPPDRSLGFPRVAVSINFKAPLFFENEFEVLVRITAISARSISYAHTVMRGCHHCDGHDDGRLRQQEERRNDAGDRDPAGHPRAARRPRLGKTFYSPTAVATHDRGGVLPLRRVNTGAACLVRPLHLNARRPVCAM